MSPRHFRGRRHPHSKLTSWSMPVNETQGIASHAPVVQTLTEPNANRVYTVTRADLPIHCPLPGASLWNSHPRVFLPIEKTGRARCPYCGAEYVLREE